MYSREDHALAVPRQSPSIIVQIQITHVPLDSMKFEAPTAEHARLALRLARITQNETHERMT